MIPEWLMTLFLIVVAGIMGCQMTAGHYCRSAIIFVGYPAFVYVNGFVGAWWREQHGETV